MNKRILITFLMLLAVPLMASGIKRTSSFTEEGSVSRLNQNLYYLDDNKMEISEYDPNHDGTVDRASTATYATNAGNADTLDTYHYSSINQVPVGQISMYGSTTAPTGYLYCNGQAVSTTTYSALYAVIGFSFGNPGSGNMNIPDMRGMFARGLDNGRGLDPDSSRVIGSTQTDTMQGHYHQITGGNTGQYYTENVYAGSGTGGYVLTAALSESANSYTARTITTNGTDGTPRTANETRPENVALAYIIKY